MQNKELPENWEKINKELKKIKDKKAPPQLWFDIEETLFKKSKKPWYEQVLVFPEYPKLALSGATLALVVLLSFAGLEFDRYKAHIEVNQQLTQVINYLHSDISWLEDDDITVGTF